MSVNGCFLCDEVASYPVYQTSLSVDQWISGDRQQMGFLSRYINILIVIPVKHFQSDRLYRGLITVKPLSLVIKKIKKTETNSLYVFTNLANLILTEQFNNMDPSYTYSTR